MKLAIIGGTGKTGKELLQQGLEAGHTIAALVRNPKKVQLVHPNLTVIQGNVLNPKDLANIFYGKDAVLSALGHKRFLGPSHILSRGTENILQAMKTANVSRFICITSMGINDNKYRLGLYYTFFVIPLIIFFYFRDKSKQERLIKDSNLNYTIVRPGQLTNGRKSLRYKQGVNLGSFIWTKMISRADVAHFMLGELNNSVYTKKSVCLIN
ncbi:NAD(P)-dependent oxidoreductase [Muriicola sp.]|uniref:NAD(P)-dependent oxidoreductase n=1 Tax=Muriicola sp. TaxID=2020856 RepID=UPI003C7661C5